MSSSACIWLGHTLVFPLTLRSNKEENTNTDIFDVLEILDKRVQWGKLLYLVRLIDDKGDEEISWESANNLKCEDKRKEYEGKSKATKSKYFIVIRKNYIFPIRDKC